LGIIRIGDDGGLLGEMMRKSDQGIGGIQVSAGARALLLGAAALAIVCHAADSAQAGAFAIREQSAGAQGASFAGAAAGGQLSSMFWNPAVMTQFPGIAVEGNFSAIFPSARNYVTSATGLGALFPGYTPQDFLDDALVPAMYAAWNVRPDLWIGISVNSPFGQVVRQPRDWPGTAYSGSVDLKTYNATPSIAYQINNWISIGAGVQIQYATAKMAVGPTFSAMELSGNGWGWGWTAGITVTPSPATTIGLGWRSFVDNDLSGTWITPLPFGTPGAVSTTLKLPDIVSLGIRHQINPAWTVMGTIEWSRWSHIGTSNVYQASGAPALVTLGIPLTLPFQYDDGWFFSAGVEYAWLPTTTLRAGVGYERTPITTAVRTPRIPDEDRVWASVGLTHAISKSLKVDLAYTHLFIDTADVSMTPGNPWYDSTLGAFGTYVGTASGHIDILSASIRYQFAPEPPALFRKG
jgi:long-chain fatty acid transport protein